MRRKTAKQILAEAFRELAKEKNIDKITVKDITDNCGYSTATFYRQFKDKYDLIAWAYTWDVTSLMDRIDEDGYEWRRTLLEGVLRLQAEKDLVTNLLLHTSGHDSFVQYMSEINIRELSKYLQKCTGKEHLDQKTEMYVRLYCMGTVCLICEWILGRYEVTPEELAEIFENSVPVPLRPLLLKK